MSPCVLGLGLIALKLLYHYDFVDGGWDSIGVGPIGSDDDWSDIGYLPYLFYFCYSRQGTI